ncbi:unnamed protein product, partial [Closterium sp. NIES-54]
MGVAAETCCTLNRAALPNRAALLSRVASAATAATVAIAATAPFAAMASPSVLTFDAEGRAVDFDVWVDDLQLFLQCDSRDGVSQFDHTSAPAPPCCAAPPVAEPRHLAEPRRPLNRAALPNRAALLSRVASAATAATVAIAATAPFAAMASPSVLTFDAEGRAVDFDVWVDDLQLFLQCDSRDGVSQFDHTSGVSTAPAATADSTVRSQWTTRDAVARLAVRSHLPLAERAHFGQYKTAQSLYDTVVAVIVTIGLNLPAVRSLHGDALGQSLRSSNSVSLPIPKALSAGQILPGGSAPQKLQIQAKILKTKRAPRDPDYPWPDKYNAEEKGFLAFLSKFKDVAKPAKPMALPFEKPLVDLEKKIDEVRQLADKTGMDFTDQVQELQDKYEQ